MKRVFILVILFALLCPWIGPVWSYNPFTSRPEIHHKDTEPPIKNRLFVKIILWQYKLKQKMSDLVRLAQKEGSVKPIMLLMGIAFAYGVIHAAGPGHGKVVAMSYVLSHRSSIMGGLLFGLCVAFFHGISGAIGVLGLRYIIQRGVNETLTTVTTVTQVASFGLIALLGLGILLKNAYASFFASAPNLETVSAKTPRKGILPWAIAAGLVPCPAVVMVMLFCMSMGVTKLGLLLTACISLGMAATISLVVTAAVMGKAGALYTLSKKRAKTMEVFVGIFSGAAIAIFGTLFLLTTISSALR
jgi:nickel/cobalt exporter